MRKSQVARAVGFVGALGASAALVGAAASSTGAYFTDSHDGQINAGTGTVKVNTTDLRLKYDKLLPGEYQTKRVSYTARGTGSEDIWLVFPTDGSADALTGEPASGPVPLGRYGHLKVASSGGAHFVSNNLARDADPSTPESCGVDANGWGGNSQEAADHSDHTVPYCAPQDAILLDSGLTNGQGGSVDLEFGFTKLLTGPQGQSVSQLSNFKIVATQHGIRPDNPNN